jgi:hypothetical protein
MFKGIFASRKFWASIGAVAVAVGLAAQGQTTWPQALAAIVAIVVGYNASTALKDGLLGKLK